MCFSIFENKLRSRRLKRFLLISRTTNHHKGCSSANFSKPCRWRDKIFKKIYSLALYQMLSQVREDLAPGRLSGSPGLKDRPKTPGLDVSIQLHRTTVNGEPAASRTAKNLSGTDFRSGTPSHLAGSAAKHCAHRAIHDRRADWCYVSGFETFLCCKTCVFQTACWPEPQVPALPCQTEPPEGAKAASSEGAVAEQSA